MSKKPGRLAGKVALVTGSPAGGIGGAIADRFAAEGATVMRHDRTHETINANPGGDYAFFAADLTDPFQCVALVEETVRRFGRLDILVNNAASTARSDIHTTSPEFFDAMIAINVRAPLLLIQAALPHFQTTGGGAILNIGSINGHSGGRDLLAYSISKGGLTTLSRNLSHALAHERIRVNHFNVGWVLSANENALQLSLGRPEDWAQRLHYPSGRLLSPEEIANYAVAFVEDGGGPISGAVVDLEQRS